MGRSIQNHASFHRNQRLFIPLMIFLLISSLTNTIFKAEGRGISKLLVDSDSLIDYTLKGREERVLVASRRLIGSRPPRCEMKCGSCGHCEAIQVPVAPQLKINSTDQRSLIHNGFSATTQTATAVSSRGDGMSNDYKPICWKCKCGDFIFNP